VTFLIAAIFCAGLECEPVTFVARRMGSEVETDWCGRYAFGKAATMARNFIPRYELTVQPDSVVCLPI
jgi:hypothetical protein